MNTRRLVLGAVLVAAVAVVSAGCGSSSDSSSTTTTVKATTTTTASGPVISGVVAPVVLSPTSASTPTTVRVGQVVEFSMGDPGQGTYVATSSDPAVFDVRDEGRTVGTSAQNAGGVAVAAGTATVTVVYEGSMNGVGAPTEFRIIVTK